MKRFLIILKGRVQGVGCRFFVAQLAKQYNLSGFVGNLDNGNVKMEVQGSNEHLVAFFKDLMKGNSRMRIDDYTIKVIPIICDEQHFTYLN